MATGSRFRGMSQIACLFLQIDAECRSSHVPFLLQMKFPLHSSARCSLPLADLREDAFAPVSLRVRAVAPRTAPREVVPQMSGALTSENDFAREILTMQTRPGRKAVARPTVHRSATDAGPEHRDSPSIRVATALHGKSATAKGELGRGTRRVCPGTL